MYSIEDKHNIFNIDDFQQFIDNKEQTDKVIKDLSDQQNELQRNILERKNKLPPIYSNYDPLIQNTIQLIDKVITSKYPSVDNTVTDTLQDLLKQLITIARNHYLDQTPVIKEQHPKIIIISTNIYRLVNRDQLFPLDNETTVFNWPAFNKDKYDHNKCQADFDKAIKVYIK